MEKFMEVYGLWTPQIINLYKAPFSQSMPIPSDDTNYCLFSNPGSKAEKEPDPSFSGLGGHSQRDPIGLPEEDRNGRDFCSKKKKLASHVGYSWLWGIDGSRI